MKKTLCIALLLMAIISFAYVLKGENPLSSKSFIGYINNYPVFDAFEEKTIYILKEHFEVFDKYPPNYRVISINNNFIYFEEEVKSGSNIVLVNSKGKIKYPVSTHLTYSAMDETGTIYYSDINDSFSIKSMKDNHIENLGIKGAVISFIDGCLYYSQSHDVNLMYANADLFELDTSKLNSSRLIASNVSGECTFIFHDRKYIFERILIDGEFKPVIYSIDKQKYNVIDIDNDFLNTIPFYSYQQKTLVFYNLEATKMKPYNP